MITHEATASNPIYCADYSQASGEPLIGSATQTDGYILVENNEAWGAKALEDSLIPMQVKDYLKRFVKGHPTVKVLLVRSPRPFIKPGLRCFVARTMEERPALYSFRVSSYEELQRLDFSAILDGDPAYQASLQQTPMLMVCTNGRRDFCCARQGVNAINAIISLTQGNPEPLVWHSSHLGGHRFAANLLCLPHGLLYGRVGLEQAQAILQTYQQGEIYLPNLRGRTCYPAVVQAADHYLRSKNRLTSISAMKWLETAETGPGEWRVQFQREPEGELLSVVVRVGEAKTQVFESCKLDKTISIVSYEFIG